ncbi:AtpZ/AtpI family protein [Candidatus Nomurabacteria bacterium]|nr:AtpZ/AtpI family protein [Candidatus Nomurabacteria bacterium]
MKDNIDSKQAWWMPAVALFIRMSFCIAGPIVIALFVGKYFDKRFNSEPKIFILSTVIAFLISVISIVRISKKYIEKLEKEAKEKNVNNN